MRESLRLVIVLGLIATISGGVLAYVHQTMSPIIEENKAAAMGEAILEVLPGAVSYEIIDLASIADVATTSSATDGTTSSSTADGTSSGSLNDATSSASASDTTSGSTVADTTSGGSVDTTTNSIDTTTSGSLGDTSTGSSLTDASNSGTLADVTTSGSLSDATSSSSVTDVTSGGSDATSGSSLTDGTSGGSVDSTSSGSLADGTSGSTVDGTSSGSVDGTSGSSVVVNVVTTYRGMDASGNTTGIAFAVDGNGFGGPIRIMVGLDSRSRKLNRVKVLDHLETPGLGARITEQAFLSQFEHKSLDDAFTAKQDVDAITGATVSSQAVAATIKNALSEVEANLRAGGIW